VILSDGDDQSSKMTFDQSMEMAVKAEATIFSISVNRGGFFGASDTIERDRILRQLAEETGGVPFSPSR